MQTDRKVNWLFAISVVAALVLTCLLWMSHSNAEGITDDPEPVGQAVERARNAAVRHSLYPTTGGTCAPTGHDEAGCVLSDQFFNSLGTCDSDRECRQKIGELCKGAGHGGLKTGSDRITTTVSGDKICSGKCTKNGAQAFVVCKQPQPEAEKGR